MPNIIRRIAAKSFIDGERSCNEIGKQLITNLHAESLLDVGAGDGSLTLEFAKVVGARKIYAVEFRDEMHPILEKKGINSSKFDVNEKWNYENNSFDFVLSSQNIEHIHRTRHYIEECFRVLKPGGHVLILTENLASWPNIIALLFGWQPFSTTAIEGWIVGNPYAVHVNEDCLERGTLQITNRQFAEKYYATGVSGTVGHVRVLSFQGLYDMMKRVGFEKVQIFTRGFPPFSGKLSNIGARISPKHGHFLVGFGKKPV